MSSQNSNLKFMMINIGSEKFKKKYGLLL